MFFRLSAAIIADMPGKQIDVFSLSDNELVDALHSLGATCGPIVGK
jgi:hypothetical protein